MTVQPITLYMCEPGPIIIDPNIAIMQTIPCANVDVTLVQTGDVFISSIPPGASIYINNVIRPEITPVTIIGLAPGTHEYKLVLQGYRQVTGTFIIISGQIIPVTETLTIIVAEAGIGGLLIAGLAFGFLLTAMKEKKES